MKHIDYEFNGKTYALSFTADALFTVYDKFGMGGDVLTLTKAMEPTAEGWKNCCWLAALMAAQGELQRRAMGYDRQEMLTMEQLRVSLSPVESNELRHAVRAALAQGFSRAVDDPDAEEEVDVVLREREMAQKKRRRGFAPR